MTHDHNDIYSIVERLRILEEGLDKNQRSVNQLGATFRPKTVAVLTAKTDPKNPMAGKLVGGAEESANHEVKPGLQSVANEDVLEKVKNSFKDFVKSVEKEITDSDIKEKNSEDTDLKKKERKHLDLVNKTLTKTKQDESALTNITVNEGGLCEIHGNDQDGFEIRRGNRKLPTRFRDMSQAKMALEMYMARVKKHNESQDYMEEQ